MRDFSTLGDKLGPKLARLISEAVVTTKRALGPHEHAIRVKASQDVIDRAGHEVADLYRPLLAAVLADSNAQMHPDVREFLSKVVSGEHQWHSLAGALGTLGQSALSQAIGNAVAPLTYRINELGPNLDLDPQTAAQAVASGIVALAEGQVTARQQGYDAGEFDTLMQLAQQIPGASDIQELVNRGLMTEAEADQWFSRAAIPPNLRSRVLALRQALLPPDLAALAVLRSVITQAEGEVIAARSGVDAKDFKIMIDDTGEPLGLEELLEAYRRGFIDKARLERGITQSRVRNEWIDVAEALRFSPMSVADAVNAVVQNHISATAAARIAEENGLAPGAVDTLIQTAGEPLSRTEMEQLYNRGLATEEEVFQALRESRLKDKYGRQAFELHTRILEPRTLASAVEFGSISHADAIKHAMAYGYSEADATVLIGEGSARKLQSFKNRVITAAESLYEASGISEQAFEQTITNLGFTKEEAGFIVKAADFRKRERQIATTVNAVRAKFIAHHLTEGQASAILDKSGLLAAQRDQLIATWKTERSAVVRNLTEAQVIRALKKQTLTLQQVDDRLIQMGYSQVDAAILIADA